MTWGGTVVRAIAWPSADAAVAPFPVRLAEPELLQLSCGGARQLRPELDRRRALEVREMLSAEVHELLLRRCRVRLRDDEGLDGLAPLLIGDTDDADLGDGGMLIDAIFDLDRRDVLAAGDDHVLLAVADRHVVLVVD